MVSHVDPPHDSDPPVTLCADLSTGFIVSVPIQPDFDTQQLTNADLTEIYDTKQLPPRLQT